MEKLFTCEEIAEHYSVVVETVWQWIRDGRLSAITVGGRYRIKESALEEFEKRV